MPVLSGPLARVLGCVECVPTERPDCSAHAAWKWRGDKLSCQYSYVHIWIGPLAVSSFVFWAWPSVVRGHLLCMTTAWLPLALVSLAFGSKSELLSMSCVWRALNSVAMQSTVCFSTPSILMLNTISKLNQIWVQRGFQQHTHQVWIRSDERFSGYAEDRHTDWDYLLFVVLSV